MLSTLQTCTNKSAGLKPVSTTDATDCLKKVSSGEIDPLVLGWTWSKSCRCVEEAELLPKGVERKLNINCDEIVNLFVVSSAC